MRDYLLATAIFCNGAKGYSALQPSCDLSVAKGGLTTPLTIQRGSRISAPRSSERIALTPNAGGGLEVLLHGGLVRILALCEAGSRTTDAPVGVAGASDWRWLRGRATTLTCCLMRRGWGTQRPSSRTPPGEGKRRQVRARIVSEVVGGAQRAYHGASVANQSDA